MDINFNLVELKKSKIRNAGVGCFARTLIPAGTLIGPYHGRYLTARERNRVKNGAYIWKLNENRYVDAVKHIRNNPLRFVNGAKTPIQKGKINCVVKMIGSTPDNEKVYYMTSRDVLPGDELIISYGNTYFAFKH